MVFGGSWIDWLIVAGAIPLAGYCFVYRDAYGNHPWLHVMLGAIALFTGLRRLLGHILDIW